MMTYDVFISHAGEDKEDVAIPLAEKLKDLGFSVWLDAHILLLGDSLRRKIDEGLSKSKYGIVILSPDFFKKEWPKKEFDALVSREDGKDKVILPIRHKISHDDIKKSSPLLADKLSVSTAKGLDFIAQQIAEVIRNNTNYENQSFDNSRVDKNIVIGISGGSCSGKTWLSHQFERICPKPICLFDLDGYYKDLNDVNKLEHNHDNPDSIDFDDALYDLAQLKAGKEVQVPKYSFESHTRIGFSTCKPASIIVVEGIFTFSKPRFLKEIDFKVWIEADEIRKYQRRLYRDEKERDRTISEIIQRYDQNVMPGYEKFIRPNRRHADIIIHNNAQDSSIPEGLYALLAYCNMDRSIFKHPI
jgi:uridine kinase